MHKKTYSVAAWLLSLSSLAVHAQTERTLTLGEAIKLAQTHSRALQMARLEIRDTQFRKDLARSSYFPQVRNESSVLHVTELAGIEIPAGAFGRPVATGLIPAQSLFIGQGGETSYTSGTGLAQPLTQLLRIHEVNRAAAADTAIATNEESDLDSQIALKVRQLFYDVLIAQATSEADRAQIAAETTRSRETEQDVRDGKALTVSAMETHAALLDAQHSLLAQEMKIRDLRMNLNDLIGLPVESTVTLAEEQDYPLVIPSRETAIQQAETTNPRILIADSAVKKARAGLGAARDTYIPDLTALARYSYQSGVPLLVHNFGTFGVNFSWDLFDGGKRRAEVEEARVKLQRAEINRDNTREAVHIELATAYNNLEQLRSLEEVAADSYATRKEIARVTGAQFAQNAALASAKDEAAAKLGQSKALLYQATLGLSVAQAEILRLLGQTAY